MPKIKTSQFEPKWVIVFIFFAAGVTLGVLVLFTWYYQSGTLFGVKRIHPGKSDYKYINPLLAVDTPAQEEFLENKTLNSKLENLINKRRKNKQIQSASVYFRDLESGRWVGVNEDLKFSPGLFLKVPIMIAYYKNAESDPKILDKKLLYIKNSTSEHTSSTLQANTYLSVNDLINTLVIEDNDDAAQILFDNINKDALNEVYSDLGVDYKEDKDNKDYISTKLHALIYRVLYNSTYLNREYSEKALQVLSESSVGLGLAAPLPNDITIAHKYRQRQIKKENVFEIHDCGLVYYSNNTYVLCLMAIGDDSEIINALFRDISSTVYEDVNSRSKPLE